MRRLTPGWATDLAILELTGSTVEDRGDHLVIRTPDNPDYHWGNCLLVTAEDSVDDAGRWTAAFAAEFPEATWCALGLPRMPRDRDAWSSMGIELEQVEVLTTSTPPRSAPLADGYSARQLIGADWDLVIERELADNARSGEHEPVAHERFVRATATSRRLLCERGLAAFFGAFIEDRLVADLGIVRCGATGRYQSVGTEPEHRRRGLASHLLGIAADWAGGAGCDTWVIVTESTNDAGRVYRRAGFTLADAAVTAYRSTRARHRMTPVRPAGAAVGIDGCPGGWIAATHDRRGCRVLVLRRGRRTSATSSPRPRGWASTCRSAC